MTEINTVCVVGGGAIGSLLAGHLGQIVDICVLTRRPEHAAALNENGLRVSGKSELQTRVRAADNAARLGHADLVIIATKALEV